jgi:hypothetical protein
LLSDIARTLSQSERFPSTEDAMSLDDTSEQEHDWHTPPSSPIYAATSIEQVFAGESAKVLRAQRA